MSPIFILESTAGKLSLIIGQDITFFIFGITLLILSFLLNKIWFKILGKSYSYFLIPGIAIHELSHIFACFLTGATIYKTKIISKSGGFVEHGKSKIPIIGNIIISFAPIVGGIAAIFLIVFLLNFPLLNFSLSVSFLFFLIQKWEFWVAFYFIVSILITLTPSSQDIKNSLTSLLLIFIIILLLKNIEIDLLYLVNYQILINFLSFTVMIQIFAFLLSLPFYFLYLLFKLI